MLKHFRASMVVMEMQLRFTYSEYVFVTLVIQHTKANAPYYIDIYDLWGSTIFSTLPSARRILGNKYWA
jgi:hypothetical protein